MLSSCAVSVVPLPSGASHLPLMFAPTPEPNGVTIASFGLLSLKGVPMKPQTTGPFTPGATDAPAWIVKRAVPYEAGRRAPPVVVGLVGGTSCEFVRLTVKSLGDRFAEASRLSTYCSLVSVLGYFE